MKKKFLTYILIGVTCLLFEGVSVNAISFKDNDTIYSVEEVKFECDEEKLYFVGVDSENNLIYSSQENEYDVYKVGKNKQCAKMTKQEILDFIKYNYSHEWYDVLEEENKFYITKYSENILYNTGYIKTTDTSLKDKKYFELVNDNMMIQEVTSEELKQENLDKYYENVYFTIPSSVEIDDELTYYKEIDDENMYFGIYEIVENPTPDDIFDYYILVGEEECYSEEKLLEINSDLVEELLEKYSYIYVEKDIDEDKFYILAQIEKTVENEYGIEYYYTYDVYDMDGNAIEELKEIDSLKIYHNSLFGVIKDEKFKLYNSNFELLYEIDKKLDLYEAKYEDYIHYVLTYDNDDDIEKQYYIYVHKTLEGNDQTFNKDDLTFRFSGQMENVSKVLVNDKELSKENYTLKSGSTIVTLNKKYLSTLKAGEYTLSVEYNDGVKVSADFKVEEMPPKTGDNIVKFFVSGIISIIGLVFVMFYLKKEREN